MIEQSQIFKYFRTLNRFIPKKEILVETFGNTDVFVTVTDSSYYIFDLLKFDILFTGPFIPGISTYLFYKDTLFLSTGKRLHKFQRASSLGHVDYEKEIKQILCVGDLVFTLHEGGELNVLEDGLVRRVYCEDAPLLLHHPHTYLNKLLLISKDHSLLFNFVKNKEVYSFKSLREGVCVVGDSKVIDVVGVGYLDGSVDIVNLKKDKVLFSLKVKFVPKEISFSKDKLCVVAGDNVHLFDLEEKRLVLKKEALSCKFVDDNHLLLSSPSCISLMEIRKDRLELVKVRNNLEGEIVGIEEGGPDNTFLVLSRGEVFRYNTGNTLAYLKQKFNGEIDMFSCKNGEGVLYGNRILYKVGESVKYVLNTEISLLCSYKSVCVILNGNLIFLNLDSQRVYRTITVDKPIKAIQIDRLNLYVLWEDKLSVLPYRETKIEKLGDSPTFEVGSFDSFKIIDSFVVLASRECVSIFSQDRVFRTFPMENPKDYTVSSDLEWLAVASPLSILIFDILTGTQLDSIKCASKLVRFTKDLLFLVVVTAQDEIVLLNNKLEFSPTRKREEKTLFTKIQKEDFLKIKKKHQKLTGEILLNKTLGEIGLRDALEGDGWITMLGEEELPRLVDKLVENLNQNNLEEFTIFINKILRNKVLALEDLEKLERKFMEVFGKYEEDYLKSVGYLELEKEKLI